MNTNTTLDKTTEIRKACVNLIEAACTVCELKDDRTSVAFFATEILKRSAHLYLGESIEIIINCHPRYFVDAGYYKLAFTDYREGWDGVDQEYENVDDVHYTNMALSESFWLFIFLQAVGAGELPYTIEINGEKVVSYKPSY